MAMSYRDAEHTLGLAAAARKGVPESEGAKMIARERLRQVTREGWTPEHDDEHDGSQLAQAAQCYLWAARQTSIPLASERMDLSEPIRQRDIGSPAWRVPLWPWEASWWKPSPDPTRNLAKAGALIAAEIDRLQRKQAVSKDGR